MNPPAIEVAGPAQAPLLADLHRSAIDPPWNAEALAALLAQPGVLGLLARTEGRPAGFILLRQAADEAEILTLAVEPARRRLGIGKTLVKEGVSRIFEDGAHRLFLEVAENNRAARTLYRNLGFSEVGRRRGYYQRPSGGAEDALILEKRVD